MSKTKNLSQIQTPVRYLPLDDQGRELVSDKSRTVAAHMPSMGERIRRYLKSPTLQRDLYRDPSLWDPEEAEVVFTDDGPKVSIHDARVKKGLAQAKANYKTRRKEEKKAKREKEAADKAARRQEILDIMRDAEIPPKNGQ